MDGTFFLEIPGFDNFFTTHEAAFGGVAEEVVKIGIRSEKLAVPRGVGAVHVDQRATSSSSAGMAINSSPSA